MNAKPKSPIHPPHDPHSEDLANLTALIDQFLLDDPAAIEALEYCDMTPSFEDTWLAASAAVATLIEKHQERKSKEKSRG